MHNSDLELSMVEPSHDSEDTITFHGLTLTYWEGIGYKITVSEEDEYVDSASLFCSDLFEEQSTNNPAAIWLSCVPKD